MKLKRKLAALLTGTMLVSTMSAMTVTAGAANYSDTAGHWAESAIERWSGYGIVQGSGGAFRPAASMTRAEMATVLSKLLGLTDKAEGSFADVPSGAWYADAVLKCAAAGILKGDGTGANPNGTITREEAAVMMGRALAVKQATGTLSFADSAQVSGWAKGYVKAMNDKGIVNGVGENRFAPAQNIDRAAVVTILDRTITGYANTKGASIAAQQSGLTLVAAPDVTITGAAADVLVAPGAANGTVTLDGAAVSGTVTVQAKAADVLLTGKASAGTVELAENAAGAKLAVGVEAGAETVLAHAEDAAVTVAGTVTDVTVDAANVAVSAQKGGTIDTVTTTAKGTTVSGEGTVKTVKTTDKNDTKVTTKDTKVEQTGEAAKPSTGGGGGGGSHSSMVTTADASSLEELQKAFADADIKTITVKGDGFVAGQDLTLTREGAGEVEIKFGKISLGDVTITAPEVTALTLSDDGADKDGAKFASLTVDAAKAHVENNVAVAGTVTIKAVKDSTFVVGDKVGSIKMAGKGKLEVKAEGAKPAVEIATSEPVALAGTMAGVAVMADGAKVSVASGAEVGTVTSTASDVALTVATESPVKLEGEIETVALESKLELEVAAGASIGTLTTAKDDVVVSGEGAIAAVAATNKITLSNATVGTVTATAPVVLNAAVEKVEANSANVAIRGAGSIAVVEATAPVAIANKSVDKVSVPEGAANVSIDLAENVTIPVVETKANVEIKGAGSVSTVDALASNVKVKSENGTVAQVTAVGDATGVTATDDSITVKTKAAAPTGVSFAEPETAKGKGKLSAANYTGLEYSKDGVTYEALTAAETETAAGTYYVRAKATADTLASEPVKGTIPATQAVTTVKITGTPVIGQMLAASVNTNATNTPGHPITYTWKAGDAEVGTGKTLTLTDAMVGKTVTVTAKNYDPVVSAATEAVQADKTALKSALKAAEAALTGVSGTDDAADKVLLGVQFVTTAQMQSFKDAIAVANTVVNAADSNTAAVAAAVTALNNAASTFNGQKQSGTWNEVAELQAALSGALKAADSAKENIVQSENGMDVAPKAQWVMADVMDAFDKVIAEAAAVKDSTDAAVLGQALANVNAATASFGSAKKLGAPIDTAKLAAAINNAALNAGSVVTGTVETVDNSYTVVAQAAADAYQGAIEAAKAAAENPANQKAVNDALAALNEATETFNSAKVSGEVDKSALNAAIKAAAVNISSVQVSKDGKGVTGQYVSEEAANAYQAAIAKAQEVAAGVGEENTQEKVTAAVTALETATKTFNAAKKDAEEIKGTLVSTAEELKTAIGNGGDIVLAGDIELTELLAIDNTVTLDLNGQTITLKTKNDPDSTSAFLINAGGNMTLNDSKGTGTIKAVLENGSTTNCSTKQIISNWGTFVMNAGTLEATNGVYYALGLWGPACSTTINGGTIKSQWGDGLAEGIAIGSNGTHIKDGVQRDEYKLTVTDGEIVGGEQAMYLPGAGTVKVSGGNISGTKEGIEIRAGSLDITGGTITATKERATNVTTNSGASGAYTGALVIAKSKLTTANDYNGDITVHVTGGSLVNNNGDALCVVHETNTKGYTEQQKVVVEIADAATLTGGQNIQDGFGSVEGDSLTMNGQTIVAVSSEQGLIDAMGNSNLETVALQNDIQINTPEKITAAWQKRASAKLVLNLNQKTLTVSGQKSVILGYDDQNDTSGQKTASNQNGMNADVTICNGTVIANNAGGTQANFIVEAGQKLTLDGVNGLLVNATGSVLLVRGQGATLNVRKSEITTTGVYCITTNAAATINNGVEINVENSTLKSTSTDHDNCAVMLNVEGVLNINGGEVSGERQGVIVRAGTAKLKDCTINAKPQLINDTIPAAGTSYQKWSSGNEVAYGALIVGNSTTSYPYAANVTLEKCNINAGSNQTLTAGTTSANVYAIYAVRDKKDLATTVAMDAATAGAIQGTVATQGEKASITVDGAPYPPEPAVVNELDVNEDEQPMGEPATEEEMFEPAAHEPEPVQPDGAGAPEEQVTTPEGETEDPNAPAVEAPEEPEVPQTGDAANEQAAPEQPGTETATPDTPVNEQPVVTDPVSEG